MARMSKTEKAAEKARVEARRAERSGRLENVFRAIREGRAYLETFNGVRKVTGYNDDTGWAITNNTGSYLNQQSYLVCLDAIKIGTEPVKV